MTGYKPALVRRRRGPWHQAGLKPDWGKPAVRNCSGGRSTAVEGLMTFCHAARKGGYILEVIGLSMFAPLLYSMVNQLLS